MAAVHHIEAVFTGRVQGVGFRYAAHQVAREFDVAGFVQNLPDGGVRVEVEGERGQAEAYVAALEERMNGFIRKVDRAARDRQACFAGFQIR